ANKYADHDLELGHDALMCTTLDDFQVVKAPKVNRGVSDIGEVRVQGLETMDYIDNLSNKERFTEQGDVITFEAEFDRVYLGSPNIVAVLDHERKQTYVIRREGLSDVVVWNPWDKKAKSMTDMGFDEYRRMSKKFVLLDCISSEVRVEGLEIMDYLDNLSNKERFTEQGYTITFEAEFNRVCLGSPNIVVVLDHERKRTYVIRREGLSDDKNGRAAWILLWHPQALKVVLLNCINSEVRVEGLETMDYLDNLSNKERFTKQGDTITFEAEVSLNCKSNDRYGIFDEYRRMVCLDGAVVANPITLKPGQERTGRLDITVAPSSIESYASRLHQ
nr:putative glucose-6-phosphate 1-epimerase [Tanacetum cinerariifolium]